MSFPGFVLLNHVTYGGLYYTSNFTGSGAQPIWTRLTITGLPNLQPGSFRVDYANPLGIQYIGYNLNGNSNGSSGSIYVRNLNIGDYWVKVYDLAIAKAASGNPNINNLMSLWTDPTAPEGTVWTACSYEQDALNATSYILRSTNYGSTWSTVGSAIARQDHIGHLQVIGNYMYFGAPKKLLASSSIGASANLGTSYGYYAQAGGLWLASVTIDEGDPSRAYTETPGAGIDDLLVTAPANLTGIDTSYGGDPGQYIDQMWTDPDNPGHAYNLRDDNLDYTTNRWVSFTSHAITGAGNDLHGLTKVGNTGAFAFGTKSAAGFAAIFYVSDKDDTSAANRSGTNTAVAPYTDSIPNVGYIAQWGIWVDEPPADKGVFVYSVEEDEIGNIPDPDNLGTPMFGDRSSWRDLDADNDGLASPTPLADYHAQDIWADTPQRHNPWPAASGEAPVSDGTKYVATDIATQAELNAHAALPDVHHARVTLDADAQDLLTVTAGQELGFDVWEANTVLAGPTTGVDNEPVHRLLVLADLPAIALDDLSDVDMTGVVDGDFVTYDAGTNTYVPLAQPPPEVIEDDVHFHVVNEDHSAECNGVLTTFIMMNSFEEETSAIYINGLRQRLNVQYTEVLDDTIEMVTAPVLGDEFISDYILAGIPDEDADPTVYDLLDSEDIGMMDSEDVALEDSYVDPEELEDDDGVLLTDDDGTTLEEY